jgi:DNA-binding Lrp family transcriptional regulator
MPKAPAPEPIVLDRLDEQIVRALQLSPRAALSLVAEVLDVSEQTVARRYRRLQRQGVIRVIGAVDPRALGQSDWFVRVRCRPDATLDLGWALCRRDDVAWVSVSAGGSELVCAVRSHNRVDRERLLFDRLPRTAAVLDISASIVLRRFAGARASDWFGVRHVLTHSQERRLGGYERPRNPRPTSISLDEGDYAMLDVLSRDGRASYRDLARAAGSTDGRATRRLAALFDAGVLYLDVDIAGAAVGFPLSAYLWLTVPPAALESTCAAMAKHVEVPYVAVVSGTANIVASITCRDVDHLYGYITSRIGAIDGVQGLEISPVLRRLKQAGTMLDGDRLAVPL